MNPNLETNKGSAGSTLDHSGVEERRRLIGQFLVDLPKGSVKTMMDPHGGRDVEVLIVKIDNHELYLDPAFVESSVDGNPISYEEAKQFWNKFKPIHDNKDSNLN